MPQESIESTRKMKFRVGERYRYAGARTFPCQFPVLMVHLDIEKKNGRGVLRSL